MKRFDGQTALIAGASSGIGRTTAIAFAREGARVVVSARRKAEIEETLDLVRQAGGDGLAVQADVTKAADVQEMVAAAVERFGRIDCAFNNAGISGLLAMTPTADYPEETFDQVISVNLRGTFICMKYEIQQFLKQGGGVIVNMSSVAGLIGSLVGAAYVASKHGVVGLTRAAAVEYAKNNIRVNAVCPGVIRTPMTEDAFFRNPEMNARMLARHPLGRFGTTEEVAEAVLWLSSGSASFITGHALPVDGGLVVP